MSFLIPDDTTVIVTSKLVRDALLVRDNRPREPMPRGDALQAYVDYAATGKYPKPAITPTLLQRVIDAARESFIADMICKQVRLSGPEYRLAWQRAWSAAICEASRSTDMQTAWVLAAVTIGTALREATGRIKL